ncbi:hypothetical protein [Dyadobacter psychrotolerans]|uniref:RHS repeat-associated core domain-containing protein n=1 Tax=Dyadobacter psychrotolerans TaxID=2541721 RepID=A0A4R5DVQ0_9BACT|nr:hypothetical protein [Dyadobacter psychrotolerans]TDE18539.1 hypothetical protein E0F88_03095 [Dyadobacter psychrotolerans]
MPEKTLSFSPYAYANDNPISMVDRDGRYAVSVHYDITYKTLIGLGYSRERADLIAHYSSTYADHPNAGPMLLDNMGHGVSPSRNPLAYRMSQGIAYDKTANSQEESNSNWHSMMSDAEADAGMTEKDAMNRGLKFGWDNIFDSDSGKDLGKLGQGLHALQDAMGHKGKKTSDHLGFNFSSVKQTLFTDMFGSTRQASNLTKSALIVTDLLQGKKANLKDGDRLNVTGMSGGQLQQVLQLLVKQGFQGNIKTD